MIPLSKRELRGCRHFNGIQHDKCRADVAYKTFQGRMPCLPKYADSKTGVCALFELYTEDEINKQQTEAAAAIAAFFSNLANDICPHCQTPITGKRQVGRCVYADPCGHRLYQGRLDGLPLEDEDETP